MVSGLTNSRFNWQTDIQFLSVHFQLDTDHNWKRFADKVPKLRWQANGVFSKWKLQIDTYSVNRQLVFKKRNDMINSIIFLLLLFLPFIFQLIFGLKAIKCSISLSFWQVSLISLLGHVFFAIMNLYLISELGRHANHRDGLAWIFVFAIELFVGFVLLIAILIQRYIKYRKNKLLIIWFKIFQVTENRPHNSKIPASRASSFVDRKLINLKCNSS